MDDELYCYEKYSDCDIFVQFDNGMHYGTIMLNGTCLRDDIKSLTGEKCLAFCKEYIDKLEEGF